MALQGNKRQSKLTLKLSAQTAKHKRQINGDVIAMVSPSAMPADSMQKPMASIVQYNFMTVSKRKGLKTESKNKMNIRCQYSMKLSVQTAKLKKTDQWRHNNSSHPLWNACGQYTKGYGIDRPVQLHDIVVKKRPKNRIQT
jgi:hypothetical protein